MRSESTTGTVGHSAKTYTPPARVRRRAAAAVVAAAGALFTIAAPTPALAEQDFRGADAEARDAAEALPLRNITLYRSGVGYFERNGQVSGDVSMVLRFDEDQVNDILKSLVLLDYDGGEVGVVRYASDEPVARRLAGFGIDVSRINSVVDLLQQLRGIRVVVRATDGSVFGAVMSIEDRMTVVTTEGAVGHFREPYVSLVTRDGVRSVAVSQIASLEIEDDELSNELNEALAVLAEARGDQTKAVELTFRGADRPRRVTAAYVHETPVWKTSYRLVAPEGESGTLTLQGWAIVENTTDEDWEGVRLSLASGRPVSFTMDLYEILYMPRPTVPVPVEFAALARTYEGATVERRKSDSPSAASRSAFDSGRGGGFADEIVESRAMMGTESSLDLGYLQAAQVTGADVGEQFVYTVDAPVTIERQRSAMLPIITGAIEGRRVSIFTANSGQQNPMRGVEMTNTSGAHLLPGPIAVYDAGAYAGDAQIPHTSRGQDRLLSYAVDLDVTVNQTQTQTAAVTSVRIVDGALLTERRLVATTAYEWTNNDASDGRTLIVEHPRSGGWEIVGVEPIESTPLVHRFEIDIEAGESGVFRVEQARTTMNRIAVADADLDELLVYQRSGAVSAELIQAVKRAMELKAAIDEAATGVDALNAEQRAIADDQDRLRRNMAAVDRNTELYRRYVTKLAEQETRLETIAEQRADWEAELESRREALRSFLRDLDVS